MEFPPINEEYVNSWIASEDGMIFCSNLLKRPEGVAPKPKRAKRVRREEFIGIDYTKTSWGLVIRNPLVPISRQLTWETISQTIPYPIPAI